ncbi:MAG: OB-fold nucleic acid binding domain-containing protein [Methanomicrobiaceae archaeon]|nr:OB-fold nucleic acid binding domain-containing protein [Methanomicrobiaceae archaeon]
MQSHYVLVDDLFSREEFERRVEGKVRESGELLDLSTAAMLVVREAGREHLQISRIGSASSCVCFFGKVLEVAGPKAFSREGGAEGHVSRILVGDETGEIAVVLWDEYAAAVDEIAPGDVLEIVGRPKEHRRLEVHAIALQKTACELVTRESFQGRNSGRADEASFDAVLLSVGERREFTRNDGTRGEMVELFAGNAEEVARVVCWAPELLSEIPERSTVRIRGARRNRNGPGEYSLGESSAIELVEETIEVSFTPVSEISGEGRLSVKGEVSAVSPPALKTGANGKAVWSREITVCDRSGTVTARVRGAGALTDMEVGDPVEIYRAELRRGILQVGFGGGLSVVGRREGRVEFCGTVMETALGRCIDDGTRWFLITEDLPVGCEVKGEGVARGRRLTIHRCEPVVPDPAVLEARLAALLFLISR